MTDSAVLDEARPLPLDAWHRGQGARMVPFAGYSMPIQYLEGIIAEHEWTRSHAGLFDVSHMGQLIIAGEGAAQALEALLPADVTSLAPGRMRYSLLLDEQGGILDDLIVTNITADEGPAFYVVVNGAMKHDDIAHLKAHLPAGVTLTYLTGQALLALQGPAAAAVLDPLFPGIATELGFMQGTSREWNGVPVGIARSGYTGEDGFELSIAAEQAEALAGRLTMEPEVKPIGLGARDSLRLEAGLPLYGHDLDAGTDPVSAGLTFALSKRRRAAGGFPGAERIARLLADGPPQCRIGLALEGRMAAREGSVVFAGDQPVGRVTSGGFAPTLGHPVAMAYVDAEYTGEGTRLEAEVRGKRLPARVVTMPFVPHRYYRKGDV
jgi:aminomethyltransferase